MPKYGVYQTVTELHRGVLGSVWSARRESDDPAAEPRFAIKTCKPDVDIAGHEQAALAVSLFLEAEELQRRLAQLEHTIWAPIYDIARTATDDGWGGGGGGGGEGGAYAVTDFFPRSAERLVAGRAVLDTPSIARLLTAALRAAQHIAQTEQRPHGNIKAVNILIGEGAEGNDLSAAKILVSDPIATRQLPPTAGEATDLRAIGELLYQLVTGQSFQQRGGWPVTSSANWTRLAGGPKWLALVNRLLDPNPAQTPPSLAETDDAIRDIASARAPRANKKSLYIAAGAGVGILAIAAGVYIATRPGPTPGPGPTPIPVKPGDVSPEQWAALCRDYSSWLSPLVQDLSRKPAKFQGQTRREYYAAAIPELAPLLATIQEQAARLDPRELVPGGAARGERYDVLANAVPASMLTEQGAKDVAQATKFVADTKAAFLGEQSLVHRPLSDAAAAWSTLGGGWSTASEYIRTIAKTASPDTFQIDALDDAIAARARVNEVERVRAEAAAHATTIAQKAAPDAILAKFGEWASAYPAERAAATAGAETLDALKAALGSVRDTGATLVSFLSDQERDAKWSQVCRSRFIASPDYLSLAAAPASAETFSRWRLLATDVKYAMPTRDQDPRRGELSRDVIAARLKGLDTLATVDLPVEKLGPVVDKVNEALAVMGETLPVGRTSAARRAATLIDQWWADALMDNCDTATVVIERGRAGSYQKIALALSSASGLLQDAVDEERGDITARIDRIWADASATTGIESAELKAAWARFRGPKPSAAQPDAKQLSRAAENTLKQLRTLEDGVPTWNPPATITDPSLRQAMKDASEARRNQLLKTFMDSKATANVLPENAWTPADVEGVKTAFAQSNAEFDAVLTAAERLRAALAGAYGSAEKNADGATLDQLLADLKARPAYEGIKSGFAALETRVAALKAVESESDPAALARLAAKPDANAPEAALAAWRRLAATRNGAWPATLADVDEETRLATPVTTLVNSLNESVRHDKNVVLAEIRAERQRRWKQFITNAKTPADIEAAFQPKYIRAEDGGVGLTQADLSEEKDTLPLLRWQLRELTAKMGTLDEPALKSAVLDFVRVVRRVPAAPGVPPIKALADELEKTVNRPVDDKPAVDLTKLGPGNLGWVCAPPPPADGSSISFEKDGVRLDFLLVRPATGDAAYVARTELSVRQFKAIADAAGAPAWTTLKSLMDPSPGTRATDSDTARTGPRAWEPDPARQIKSPTDWLQNNAAFREQHPYADPFQSKPNDPRDRRIKDGMRAVDDSPMQYIAPAPALVIARLANCRFPTPAEWAAASSNAAPAANLRDQAWKTQFDYNGPSNPSEGSFYNSVAGSFGAAPAISGNDGVLWFMPVADPAAAPTQFAHLRGNVAEYILDAPDARLATLPAAAAPNLAEACSAFLSSAPDAVAVIGASAIGPPPTPSNSDRADPIAPGDRVFNAPQQGWCDVGIRLAFGAQGATVKPPSLAELTRQALDTFAYGTTPP